VDLMVYFCWNFGVTESLDPEFGRKIKWDTPLLEGYNFKFLKNFSLKPSSGFWGQLNPSIIWELFKDRPDLLIIFGWNSYSNWLAAKTAKILGIKIAVRGENPLNQELLKASWKLFIKKIIFIPVFKLVNFFLYIGEENRKFYKYYGVSDKKLFFAPYAVDNNFFFQKNEEIKSRRTELRAKYGFGVGDTVLLFVGKLIEKKRPQDLLLAYRKLVLENPNLKLVFVGDGNLRLDLEKETTNLPGVVFVGFKNQSELPEFYTLADTFVLPSGMGETWGLVINEAMCFGLPVLVSSLVGCGSNLVKEGKNGFIFQFGDIEDLCVKLKLLVSIPHKMSEFGHESKEVIKKYSFGTDAEVMVNLIK
jgi:glycosyltransferase involved in cell wall biosynthesis